ncbi:heavy-metal-associated domain-containing protein [Gordonia insulae]|nr:heavy-metal-associated domain-containing protein [Gordonia insulae]
MMTTTYMVTGMTCAHCVASVREEIGEINGVDRVDVTLDTGAVEITSTRTLDRAEVEAAVAEAGYQLT